MTLGVAPLLLVFGLVAGAEVDAASVESGTLLKYRGQIVAAEGDPVDSRKKIELTLLVSSVDDSGAALHWTITERGRGAWPWPERFGSVRVDGRWRTREPALPSVLYDRQDGKSAVPIPWPLFAAERPLAVGLTWAEDRLEYRVTEEAKVAERAAWRVEVHSPYGRKRTLLVDKASPVVLAISEVVFMGEGQQYELTLELAERSALEAEGLERAVAAWNALGKLRDDLGYIAGSGKADFTAAQLGTVQTEIPAVQRLAADGPLATLVHSIADDARDQKGRNSAVAALRDRQLGSEPMPFSLQGLKGESLTHDDLQGKVTVLHFWPYLDNPLEEPYGQVGYLDFLHRKRKSEGVVVYGVAVDLRLGDERERRAAMNSVKKLVAFMNLDYPVLLDDGTVLKRFGDPRRADADLPLFVVIGPDGKIAEYHVGFYEVNRDRGLEELNAVLTKSLRTRE